MAQATKSEDIAFSHTRMTVFASLNDFLFTPSRTVFLSIDAVVVFTSFLLAWRVSPYGDQTFYGNHAYVLAFVYTLAFTSISLGLGQYERLRRFRFVKILTYGVVSSALSSAISIAAAYLWYHENFGRLTVAWGAGGSLLMVTLVRCLFAYLLSFHPYKFAIYGKSPETAEIISYIEKDTFRTSRYFSYYNIDTHLDADKICQMIYESPIYDFVTTEEFRNRPDFQRLLLEIIKRGVRIVDEQTFYEDFFEKVSLDRFSVPNLLLREFNSRRVVNDALKRIFDVTVSFLGLIILSPLLILIAVLIKASSKGPMLFVQPRQGRLGRQFQMYKFRTMSQERSCVNASGGFTRQGDARVTMIGKLLRPLHLDELPQLINIFLGHMSLVGPRPEALSFARKMSNAIPQYDLRYIMRPGLTGHAQLMAGYMMDTVEDTKTKLSYDLFYIRNNNFGLDMCIIMRTAFVVLKKLY